MHGHNLGSNFGGGRVNFKKYKVYSETCIIKCTVYKIKLLSIHNHSQSEKERKCIFNGQQTFLSNMY